MTELAGRLLATHPVHADLAELSRCLCGLGFTYKTRPASECERADVAKARQRGRQSRLPRMPKQPGRLVFIDETSVNTKMTRLRGGSRKAERFKVWSLGTQTFIAALRCDGLTALFIIDRTMNRAAFDIHIETQLAPTLSEGDICNLFSPMECWNFLKQTGYRMIKNPML
jgi:hypothetical protein